MSKLIPARLIHPLRIFEMELEAREETVESLAEKTGLPWEAWQQVLDGGRINEYLAIALEQAWGISAQFWLNLWENYNQYLVSNVGISIEDAARGLSLIAEISVEDAATKLRSAATSLYAPYSKEPDGNSTRKI